MHISTIRAENLGFDSKHWSTQPRLGSGRGPEQLRRASGTVLNFLRDRNPRDLKLAASTIWLTVEHAHIADLYGAMHDRRDALNRYKELRQSEDGWELRFIRDGIGFGEAVPNNLGLLFTRSGYDETPGAVSRVGGRPRPIIDLDTWHTDAYVWVEPNSRNNGIGTATLEQLVSAFEIEIYDLPLTLNLLI